MKGIRNFKSLLWSVVLMGNFCSVGFGQEWEKILNIKNSPTANVIVETSDNFYWIGGASERNPINGSILVKLNQFGDTIFTKKNTSFFSPILTMSPTKENGVAIISAPGFNLPQVRRIDKDGNVLWVRQIVFPQKISFLETIHPFYRYNYTQIKELANEDIFVARLNALK